MHDARVEYESFFSFSRWLANHASPHTKPCEAFQEIVNQRESVDENKNDCVKKWFDLKEDLNFRYVSPITLLLLL